MDMTTAPAAELVRAYNYILAVMYSQYIQKRKE